MVALYAAAAALYLTGLAHSYLGERYILIRLFRRDNLPALLGGTAFTTGTLRFVWHLTTIAWWGLATLLVMATHGTPTRAQVLDVIGITCLVSAVFPIVFTRGRHLSWVVFLLAGALTLIAAHGG